jgi:hypothetical protein
MTIQNFIALFRDPFVEYDEEEVYFPKILFKVKTGYGYVFQSTNIIATQKIMKIYLMQRSNAYIMGSELKSSKLRLRK